jgi:hypothetical protein
MGKKVSIFCFLLILFLSANAFAVSFNYAGIFSEHRKYSDDFGSADFFIMVAVALVDEYDYQVGDYVQVTYDGGPYTVPYLSANYTGMDVFAGSMGAPSTAFTGKTYSIELKDKDDIPILTSSWIVSENPYPFNSMNIPYVTKVDSGKDYFEWEQVPGAEYYDFAVAPVDESGQPVIGEVIFISQKLYETNYTLPNGIPAGDYALWIRAKVDNPNGTMPNKFTNRSSYLFKYTIPNRTLHSLPILLLSGDD